MQQKHVITHPEQAGRTRSRQTTPQLRQTTPKARSKRRSTHFPNQTQYGSTLLGENLSKYKHGTLRLNLPP